MIDLMFALLAMALRIVSLLCVFRFLFQLARVNPNIPIVKSVVQFTNIVLSPLRASLPSGGTLDIPSLVGAWLTMAAYQALLIFNQVSTGAVDTLIYSAWHGLIQLLYFTIWIFMIAIVAGVVISWVAPQSNSPNVLLVRQLANPLLRPIQQLLPSLGGLDFSPALVLLLLATMLQRVLPWLSTLFS